MISISLTTSISNRIERYDDRSSVELFVVVQLLGDSWWSPVSRWEDDQGFQPKTSVLTKICSQDSGVGAYPPGSIIRPPITLTESPAHIDRWPGNKLVRPPPIDLRGVNETLR